MRNNISTRRALQLKEVHYALLYSGDVIPIEMYFKRLNANPENTSPPRFTSTNKRRLIWISKRLK